MFSIGGTLDNLNPESVTSDIVNLVSLADGTGYNDLWENIIGDLKFEGKVKESVTNIQ